MTITGYTSDLQAKGFVGAPMTGYFTCPKCGFTAASDSFDSTEGLDLGAARTALANLDTAPVFRRVDAALAIERVWTKDPDTVADLTLVGKGTADDTGDPAMIEGRRLQAIDAHKAALAATDDRKRKGRYTYLIGELLLQEGETEEAIDWLKRATRYDALRGMAEEQLLLAQQQGRPVADIIEAMRATEWRMRLEAAVLIARSEDEEAVAFVQNVILTTPSQEAAYRLGDKLTWHKARPHHLPAYLAALHSDQSWVVECGAMSVGNLRAREALPDLLDLLERADPSDYSAIDRALAAMATEEDIPLLDWLVAERYPAAYRPIEPFLCGYLNTRSAKAIPSIMALLEASPDVLHFVIYQPKIVESARAFGLGLLRELIAAAPENSREDLERLLAVVEGRYIEKRWGEFDDAYELTRRAKEYLEGQQRALEERVAKSRTDPAAMRQRWVASPRYMTGAHLMELGMTGDERARPILMADLDDPDPDIRSAAVSGLGYVWDKAVGDALAARLVAEEPDIQTSIIAAMGRADDGSHVDLLVEFAAEPSLVRTKLAWIQAMEKLAPARAVPALEYWATSPNDELAVAARKALARIE